MHGRPSTRRVDDDEALPELVACPLREPDPAVNYSANARCLTLRLLRGVDRSVNISTVRTDTSNFTGVLLRQLGMSVTVACKERNQKIIADESPLHTRCPSPIRIAADPLTQKITSLSALLDS